MAKLAIVGVCAVERIGDRGAVAAGFEVHEIGYVAGRNPQPEGFTAECVAIQELRMSLRMRWS